MSSFINHLELEELSLKDLVEIVMVHWKVILISSLLGLIGAILFISGIHNQYGAKAQIQMAQFSSGGVGSPLGQNVEDPAALVARMRLPSSYSSDVLNACGFNPVLVVEDDITSLIKISQLKGVPNIIELTIVHNSKKMASDCVLAVFENIRQSQIKISDANLVLIKKLLSKNEAKLKEINQILNSPNIDSSTQSIIYLSNRDEKKILTEDIIRLNSYVDADTARQAKLISPIYFYEISKHSKKRTSLIVGILGGIFLGILYIFLHRFIARYKRED